MIRKFSSVSCQTQPTSNAFNIQEETTCCWQNFQGPSDIDPLVLACIESYQDAKVLISRYIKVEETKGLRGLPQQPQALEKDVTSKQRKETPFGGKENLLQ